MWVQVVRDPTAWVLLLTVAMLVQIWLAVLVHAPSPAAARPITQTGSA